MFKLVRNCARVARRGILAAGLCMWCGQASAGQWVGPFTVTSLFVAGANNYQYRLNGMPTISACSNGSTWAYLNDADSGSKGKVATILAAFYSGRQVGIFVEVENGYCHLIDLIAY